MWVNVLQLVKIYVQPLKLVDANGNDIFLPETDVLAQYFLPGKAIVSLDDGAAVKSG